MAAVTGGLYFEQPGELYCSYVWTVFGQTVITAGVHHVVRTHRSIGRVSIGRVLCYRLSPSTPPSVDASASALGRLPIAEDFGGASRVAMTQVVCDRVTIWEHPDTSTFDIGSGTLSCPTSADTATVEVSATNVPKGLDILDTEGWPIHCSRGGTTVLAGAIETSRLEHVYAEGDEYRLAVVPPAITTP